MSDVAELPFTKLAAYVILGINTYGRKDVLSIEIGENESAKYWLMVFNTHKNLIMVPR